MNRTTNMIPDGIKGTGFYTPMGLAPGECSQTTHKIEVYHKGKLVIASNEGTIRIDLARTVIEIPTPGKLLEDV